MGSHGDGAWRQGISCWFIQTFTHNEEVPPHATFSMYTFSTAIPNVIPSCSKELSGWHVSFKNMYKITSLGQCA